VIPRYSRPEMARIWSDESRFSSWLQVEIAATEVLAEGGVVPREALAAIKAKARFEVARIDAIEKEVQHDVIAFVSNVAENVGPEGRWIHYGLTSSDVVDTALAMLMRDACALILEDLHALMVVVKERALEFKHTPMVGRTHGVHAEVMTFGLKLALWHAQLARDDRRLTRARETIAVGKLSGAVGTFSHLGPDVEAAVCARLGLRPAPIASQVLQRDQHAEVMTSLAIAAASSPGDLTAPVRRKPEAAGTIASWPLSCPPSASSSTLLSVVRPLSRLVSIAALTASVSSANARTRLAAASADCFRICSRCLTGLTAPLQDTRRRTNTARASS